MLAADRYTYLPALLLGLPASALLLHWLLAAASARGVQPGTARLVLGLMVLGLAGGLGRQSAEYGLHWERTEALWELGLSQDPWVLGVVGEPSWPHVQRGHLLLESTSRAGGQPAAEALASFGRALEVEPTGPAGAAAEAGSGKVLRQLAGGQRAIEAYAAFGRAVEVAAGTWPAARAWFELGRMLEEAAGDAAAVDRLTAAVPVGGMVAEAPTAAHCYSAAAGAVERHCSAIECPATQDGEDRDSLAVLRAQALANLASVQLASGEAAGALAAADAVVGSGGTVLAAAPAELATGWCGHTEVSCNPGMPGFAMALLCGGLRGHDRVNVAQVQPSAGTGAARAERGGGDLLRGGGRDRRPGGTGRWGSCWGKGELHQSLLPPANCATRTVLFEQPHCALMLHDRECRRAAQAWSNRGNALTGLGRLEEAVASCQAALAIAPDYAQAWVNLGVAIAHSSFAHHPYARALPDPQTHSKSWARSGGASNRATHPRRAGGGGEGFRAGCPAAAEPWRRGEEHCGCSSPVGPDGS